MLSYLATAKEGSGKGFWEVSPGSVRFRTFLEEAMDYYPIRK